VLHASNSALTGRIGATWLGSRAGIGAGALFAMFPASVEAVAWNAGIFDLASTTCALGAVAIAQAAYATTARAWAIGAIVAAGLLSKETAVAIPALVLLVAIPVEAPRLRTPLAQLGIASGVALLYLLLRAALTSEMAGHLQHLPADRRAWKDLIVRPFSALAVPMRSDLGMPVSAYIAGLLVLVLLAVAVVHMNRVESTPQNRGRVSAVWFVGMAWVGLSTLPLLLSFYVAPTLEGSRYLYLPAAGWALALASALVPSDLRWMRPVGWVAVALLLAIFAGRIMQERDMWLEAARVRDVLLTDAARLARQMSCRSLEVENPPDNVRGVFVFRQGLPQALAPLTDRHGSNSCVLRWTGSDLVAVSGS
jgi:hypothetical protein